MYQQQALWDNRQYPRVYRAFTGIWQTTHLWVTLDRANMKPPVRADHAEWQHSVRRRRQCDEECDEPVVTATSATDSAPCRLTNPTFPWLDGSHRLRLIFTKFTVTSSYGST